MHILMDEARKFGKSNPESRREIEAAAEHILGFVPFQEIRVEAPPPRPRGSYTPPKPPPEGLDPVKWAHLSRKDRRALLRYHRRQIKGTMR